MGPGALIIAVVLVSVGASATTALLQPEGRVDAAITGGVLAAAFVTASVVAPGLVGELRSSSVLIVNFVEATIPVLLVLRRRRPIWHLPASKVSRPNPLRHPWAAAVVGIAALCLAWQLVVALVLPPFAYDALTYHLTTMATWVTSGRLRPSPLSLCCAYYPSNAETLTAWPTVLLGRDALVDVVQVFAAVLGGLAVVGIGRTAGLSRTGAAVAGALYVLTPVVLAQAPTAYVDSLLTALVLSGLHGVARFAETARLSRLVVPSMSAGLLAGTKGTGLLWATVLVLTGALVSAVHVHRGRLRPRQTLIVFAGGVGACAVLSGWWYLRNLVDKGNPVYPFELRLGSRTLFSGPFRLSDVITAPREGGGRPWPMAVAASWAADLLPWRHGTYDYQQRLGGLGPLWSWLGFPLLIAWTARFWRRRNSALVAVIPVLLVLLVQPYRWWARFTLPLAALGAIAVMLTIEFVRRAEVRRGLQLATTGLAVTGAVLVIGHVNPASRADPISAWRVLGLARQGSQERSLGRLFFPEYRFLEQIPSDGTIVVDLNAEPVRFVYPLFGPDLRRTVLPAGVGTVPDSAWVVTSAGRPLDDQMMSLRPGPAFDERGVRVWAPRP